MMKRYTLFHAPLMAFFSRRFYRDVGLNWQGTGFAYLFLLLTICWALVSAQLHFSIVELVETKAPGIAPQVPRITIIKDEASVDVAQPYKIMNPESGKVLALIDTTGKTLSLEGTDARLLMTRTGVLYKKNDGKITGFEFKGVKHFTLDQQKISEWLRMFRNYGAVAFFFLSVLGSFVFRIAQTLLYAAIGLLFARGYKTRPAYQTLLRISVMAITPVILVNTISEMARVTIPLDGVLYFIAAMVYLLLGVKAVSDNKEAWDAAEAGGADRK